MRLRIVVASALAASVSWSAVIAQQAGADPTGSYGSPEVAALLERLEAQEQRIRVLERKLEIQEEAATASAAAAPVARASGTAFSLQAADGAHSMRLRGTLHFDGRRFNDSISPETADTWLLRRARPIVEGTLANIYDFRFTPDFASGRTVVQDAYLAARFRPWATVTG